MDDGFIITPEAGFPATIVGMEPDSAGAGAAPRRRSSRRRVVTSRPNDPFDPPNLHGSSQTRDFEVIPDKTATERWIHLADNHVGVGCELALELLDQRITGGDTELLAVKHVMQRCLSLISVMPPLSHVDSVPLRPDDRLYEFFDQVLSLLRQQECQMQELQTIIHELI